MNGKKPSPHFFDFFERFFVLYTLFGLMTLFFIVAGKAAWAMGGNTAFLLVCLILRCFLKSQRS